MSPRPSAAPRGLFRRIYLTFVGTVTAFAAITGLVFYSLAARYGPEWVAAAGERFEAHAPELLECLDDPPALAALVASIGDEFDAQIAIRTPFGRLLAGDPGLPRPPRRRLARLESGQPLVVPQGRAPPPVLHWGLTDPDDDDALVAILTVDPHSRGRERWMLALIAVGLLVILALGALPLARSLVRRLAAVERSAEQIADGDLSHRVPLPAAGPRDEVDGLAATFNRMASRLQQLVQGQRILLANVSHELRTPVARMRVLLEILGERVELLQERLAAPEGAREGPTPPAKDVLGRLGRGLHDLEVDLKEMEALINDLLTSGKLELGSGAAIERAPIAVAELLGGLGDRYAAEVTIEPAEATFAGDRLLLGRLLANLLANARRACPDGAIELAGRIDGDALVLTVDDHGPGIPAGDREVIFEPFTRLDAARDRDRGGVGLGLHLCRQIAAAHGGTIRAEGRVDGAPGARFVVRLPLGT